METDTLIIGAGAAGLVAARELQADGRDRVLLVDKGRGVGGRMATRRKGDPDNLTGRWDHGAQFITLRNPAMRARLQAWDVLDLLEPWMPAFSDPALVRGRPLAGINALAKSLAAPLDIRRGAKITRLEKEEDRWRVHAEDGSSFQALRVLCTLPVPQFLELAGNSGLPLSRKELPLLESVDYERCLTLLLETDGPSGLPDAGYHRINSGLLETLIDQHAKGISPTHTLVAHASASFSREWYDRDRSTAASVLRAAVQEQISSTITGVRIHGWKYAKAVQRIPRPFLQLENGILLAGDGFMPDGLHPRIESAMLSGLAAARAWIGQPIDA